MDDGNVVWEKASSWTTRYTGYLRTYLIYAGVYGGKGQKSIHVEPVSRVSTSTHVVLDDEPNGLRSWEVASACWFGGRLFPHSVLCLVRNSLQRLDRDGLRLAGILPRPLRLPQATQKRERGGGLGGEGWSLVVRDITGRPPALGGGSKQKPAPPLALGDVTCVWLATKYLAIASKWVWPCANFGTLATTAD